MPTLTLPQLVAGRELAAEAVSRLGPLAGEHVVVDARCFTTGHVPQILDTLQECVAHHFDVSIEHSTFQIEPSAHAAHEAPGHP